MIRNPQQRADTTAVGATPVTADVESLTTEQIAQVLVGYDAVVWSAGAGGGSAERTYAVDRDAAIRSMDAARLAGVTRYVMVSYQGSRVDHGASQDDGMFAYYEAKAAADDYLRGTDLSWTILGPSTKPSTRSPDSMVVTESDCKVCGGRIGSGRDPDTSWRGLLRIQFGRRIVVISHKVMTDSRCGSPTTSRRRRDHVTGRILSSTVGTSVTRSPYE